MHEFIFARASRLDYVCVGTEGFFLGAEEISAAVITLTTVASVCPYCGCGCRLLFIVEENRVVKMLPDRTDGPSEGIACIKGLTIHETMSTDEGRILEPMIRNGKSEEFQVAS